jgi:hypothetical protein
MKLDDWLTRLVAVPPGCSPLANGLAIGTRIALFILIPLGIIAAVASFFYTDKRNHALSRASPTTERNGSTVQNDNCRSVLKS